MKLKTNKTNWSQKTVLLACEKLKSEFCEMDLLLHLQLNLNKYLKIEQIKLAIDELLQLGYLREVGRKENVHSKIKLMHYKISINK